MKICQLDGCSNIVKTKQAKYCSLLCANQIPRVRRKPKKTYKAVCENCNEIFEYSRDKRKFCSQSCAATYNNAVYRKRKRLPENIVKECPWCYSKISRKDYCSLECRQKFEVYEWLAGRVDGNTKYTVKSFVRAYILSRSGGRCEGIDSRTGSRCTEDRIVQLDHINGNPFDSVPENLRHLCPTCHTLTPTYGGKNVGKGRSSSRDWKQVYNQYIPVEVLRALEKFD